MFFQVWKKMMRRKHYPSLRDEPREIEIENVEIHRKLGKGANSIYSICSNKTCPMVFYNGTWICFEKEEVSLKYLQKIYGICYLVDYYNRSREHRANIYILEKNKRYIMYFSDEERKKNKEIDKLLAIRDIYSSVGKRK